MFVAPVVESHHFKSVPFMLYTLMIFFVIVADSCMSYYAPVVMTQTLGSETMMGVILATSSTFGMLFDFLFSKAFGDKKSNFFTKMFLATAVFFPLSFLLYRAIPSFLFGMFIWGLYYEGIVFSNFHAVHEYVQPRQHAWAWTLLSMMKGLGVVVGSFMASQLMTINLNYPFYFTVATFGCGAVVFLIRKITQHTVVKHVAQQLAAPVKHSFTSELKIWRAHAFLLWPLLIMIMMSVFIDATFFSIGPLFAEELGKTQKIGSTFVTMYTLGSLLFTFTATYFAHFRGKKRAAYFAGYLAGIGLFLMSFLTNVWLILGVTFLSSACVAIMATELNAIFEDYIVRSPFGHDLVGLIAIMASFAYVVGPIFNGFVGERISAQFVFSVWGILLSCISVVAFAIVKRKVRLPHYLARV